MDSRASHIFLLIYFVSAKRTTFYIPLTVKQNIYK